jgi:outer membrane protein
MKYVFNKTFLALLALTVFSAAASAQVRLGTVDLRKVFDNYWKTKQADAALKDRSEDMMKEHKTMMEDWEKNRKTYTELSEAAGDKAISPEEREKRKKSAEDKLKEIKEAEGNINTFERQARTTIDEQRKRMRDNILTEIKTVLNAKAKAAGYTMVIDTAAESANNTPIVIYVSDNKDNDLTEATLSQLNAGAPAETSKADDKKDEKKEEKKDAGKEEKKK